MLVACEFSGVVRRAFREVGCDAWSCDLLPAEDGSPYHFQCDVREVLCEGWDLLVAHPPCTYLANVAVCFLKRDPSRWSRMQEAVDFFLMLYNAPVPRVCVENPVMHRYALEAVGVRPTQIIQPWQFGESYTKRTCLWLRGLSILLPTHAKPPGVYRLVDSVFGAPRQEWWKIRSRTSPCVARAMADQWGWYCVRYPVPRVG